MGCTSYDPFSLDFLADVAKKKTILNIKFGLSNSDGILHIEIRNRRYLNPSRRSLALIVWRRRWIPLCWNCLLIELLGDYRLVYAFVENLDRGSGGSEEPRKEDIFGSYNFLETQFDGCFLQERLFLLLEERVAFNRCCGLCKFIRDFSKVTNLQKLLCKLMFYIVRCARPWLLVSQRRRMRSMLCLFWRKFFWTEQNRFSISNVTAIVVANKQQDDLDKIVFSKKYHIRVNINPSLPKLLNS